MPPALVFAHARGHPSGWWNPNQYRIAAWSIPVGSHVSHAVGFAFGERLQGRDTVALVFFGDGATSEGEFHEAANIAGVLNAPVVLLCNNNQWAISTPFSKQTRAASIAVRAQGYGYAGVRVDGNDVVAVHKSVAAAAEQARSGGGPTLVECVTYRGCGHAAADDDTLYRDKQEVARRRTEEGVRRLEVYLTKKRLLPASDVEMLRKDAAAQMSAAFDAAEALKLPPAEYIFEHVFTERTRALDRDRAATRRLLEKMSGSQKQR